MTGLDKFRLNAKKANEALKSLPKTNASDLSKIKLSDTPPTKTTRKVTN